MLAYWFSGDADARKARWWSKSEATDNDIRERFGGHVDAAAAGAFDAWTETPRGTLALVLLLDQVTRTIHRGSPKSWAYDAKAREVARRALQDGLDRQLATGPEKTFLYMPLMHSEQLADQERCVALFEALAESFPEAAGNAEFAEKHRVIIARFGRFPHRNAVLGRANTADEAEFLSQPGSGF